MHSAKVNTYFHSAKYLCEKNEKKSISSFLHLFPAWERLVPSLGMKRSHVGNELFPRWEYTIRASPNNLKR